MFVQNRSIYVYMYITRIYIYIYIYIYTHMHTYSSAVRDMRALRCLDEIGREGLRRPIIAQVYIYTNTYIHIHMHIYIYIYITYIYIYIYISRRTPASRRARRAPSGRRRCISWRRLSSKARSEADATKHHIKNRKHTKTGLAPRLGRIIFDRGQTKKQQQQPTIADQDQGSEDLGRGLVGYELLVDGVDFFPYRRP